MTLFKDQLSILTDGASKDLRYRSDARPPNREIYDDSMQHADSVAVEVEKAPSEKVEAHATTVRPRARMEIHVTQTSATVSERSAASRPPKVPLAFVFMNARELDAALADLDEFYSLFVEQCGGNERMAGWMYVWQVTLLIGHHHKSKISAAIALAFVWFKGLFVA